MANEDGCYERGAQEDTEWSGEVLQTHKQPCVRFIDIPASTTLNGSEADEGSSSDGLYRRVDAASRSESRILKLIITNGHQGATPGVEI